jgi:uncharacterized protein (TIGR02246 family)
MRTLDGAGLDEVRKVTELPRWPASATPEVRLELLHEESLLRDQVAAYGYAFDAGDLDAVMEFFADDCIIVNPRGEYAGRAAIKANYEKLFAYWSSVRHLWTNVAIRFPNDPDEAYMTAYHHAVIVRRDGQQALAPTGTDIRRLRKIDGAWKIVERAISDDLSVNVDLHEGPVEDPKLASADGGPVAAADTRR